MIARPEYSLAFDDIAEGAVAWRMWTRMGWQEIKRRYRRTTIGPFWTTLSLAVFIFMLGVVWARLWGKPIRHYLPFLTGGLIAWSLVSALITESCQIFVASAGLIKQRPVSYMLLTCALVWRNLIVFGHNLIIMAAVYVLLLLPLHWAILLVVPGLALLAVNGLWLGLLFGLLCARYRDIQQVVGSVLQVALFVTPIFWSADQLSGRLALVIHFNVLFHLIEIVRAPLLGFAPSEWSYVYCALSAAVGWMVTLYLFARLRQRIPYWL